jgi:Leucine-rich repeat (LRR) protein
MDLSYCSIEEQPKLSRICANILNLDGNYLTDLYSERCPRGIEILRCNSNSLSHESLPSHFPETLKEIHLAKNQIQHLQRIESFPETLRILNLNSNRLIRFPSNLPRDLEEIHICLSYFETLDNLPPNLKKLEAESGCIKMIQSRLPLTIERVNLKSNHLRQAGLPLFWGNQLRELFLGGNMLREFPKKLPDTLEVLHLKRNKITHIPGNLPPSLRILILSQNRIRTIELESRKNAVEYVDCKNNCLTDFEIIQKALQKGWGNIVNDFDNWNLQYYSEIVLRFQKAWRKHRMESRLRAWKKTGSLKASLLEKAMAPERAGKFESPSPEWRN